MNAHQATAEWSTASYRPGPRLEGIARAAAISLAVAVSYYLGSRLGLLLRFPPETTSVLWPPNAILTATLLLTTSRRWWLYLAAALPAHLAVQSGTGWPIEMILALFVTNCSEAILAAWTIQAAGKGPVRFDTLRGMTIFLAGAVLIAPFVSSFPDAAIVTLARGEPFWTVWSNRFFSNTLTELLVVPAIVMLVRGLARPLRFAWPAARMAEAGLFALATILTAALVFATGTAPALAGGLERSPFAALLAPALWGTVRFGPAGTSFSLLASATVALWGGVHGHGFLAGVPAREAAILYQSVIWSVAVPLMFLAAMVREREKSEVLLRERLGFERLMSEFARAQIHARAPVAGGFDASLGTLGERLGLDRLALFARGREHDLVVQSSWTSPDAPSASEALPTALARLAERAAHEADGASSSAVIPGLGHAVAVPLVGGGETWGALVAVRREPSGDDAGEIHLRLGLVADVLAAAIARDAAAAALRATEEMKSAILTSLPTGVAVIDRRGVIVSVNEGWRRLACADEVGRLDEGDNYLERWGMQAAAGLEAARPIVAGLRRVLDGAHASYSCEFPWTVDGVPRWFGLSAVALAGAGGGAVVSKTDVTERRKVELEAQSSRQDLAHFLRISTVGVLASSLAHELNQPLTAILANAQAAQRLRLDRPDDRIELGEILSDMIDQDKRAGAVIGHLRDMLHKGEVRRERLDLGRTAAEVARLLTSDALIRKVVIDVDVRPGTPPITGDAIQIQQVLLNLLLNALQAAETRPEGRRVHVVVRGDEEGWAEVSVSDSGPGIPAGWEEKIFEPFFSTKPAGMGMGLSIARSIVSAHGGKIGVVNEPRGATFRFRLPAVAA
jgi:signal transduction histidine kinase/integral membrane sensor domain MASE1